MMNNGAILLLCCSTLCISFMAVLRKEYQKSAGSDFMAVVSFIFLTSFVSYILGSIVSDALPNDFTSFMLAFLYAFLSVATSIMCLAGTKYGSLTTMILYAFLGTLTLPTIYGFFTEPFDFSKDYLRIIGFLIAIIILLCDVFFERKNEKNGNKIFKLLCFFVFFTNGSALIVFKLFNKLCPDVSDVAFVTFCMLISAIVALTVGVISVFVLKKKSNIQKRDFNIRVVFVVGLYALAFFLSDNLSLRCASFLPIMVQATLSFCLPIIFTALLEFIIYKEKPTKVTAIQLILSFLCCMCFVI